MIALDRSRVGLLIARARRVETDGSTRITDVHRTTKKPTHTSASSHLVETVINIPSPEKESRDTDAAADAAP